MGYEILSAIRRFKFLLFGVAITSFSVVAQAPLDIRVALVIGNSAYVSAPALTNPSNDAKAITNILKRLGFTVINVNDGTKEQMIAGIAQMQAVLKGQQAVGMLYYAGHGVQQNWRNYMVPVDFKVSRDVDIPKQAIDVDTVIEGLKKAGTRMNIIVLDACRDNPFGSQASGKGLAQLEAPLNTYIAFATAPGNVAQDGNEKTGNGLFTEYIIKELQKPAPIEDMFKRVRLQVRKASNGSQIPWDSSSLEMDFAFNDGKRYTFNPDDLIKEAQEARAKEEELKRQLAQAKEQERKIAEQREQERLNLVQIQKIKELEAKVKAEEESKEREKQLKLAQDKEKKISLELAQALEKTKLDENKRLQDIQLATVQDQENAKKFNVLKNEDKKKSFAQEKSDWDKIKDSNNADDFYAYLNKYPNGLISEQAMFRLNQLAESKVIVQPLKDGIVQNPNEKRFRVGDEWSFVTKNNLTGKISEERTRRVEKIENGRVYVMHQSGNYIILTEDGGELTGYNNVDGLVRFDPPEVRQPGGIFEVGKKWVAESNMTVGSGWSTSRQTNGKVVGLENLVIRGQTFKTYKVETVSINLKDYSEIRQQRWYQPGFGISLKTTTEVRERRMGLTRSSTTELISFTKGSG